MKTVCILVVRVVSCVIIYSLASCFPASCCLQQTESQEKNMFGESICTQLGIIVQIINCIRLHLFSVPGVYNKVYLSLLTISAVYSQFCTQTHTHTWTHTHTHPHSNAHTCARTHTSFFPGGAVAVPWPGSLLLLFSILPLFPVPFPPSSRYCSIITVPPIPIFPASRAVI